MVFPPKGKVISRPQGRSYFSAKPTEKSGGVKKGAAQ